MKNKAVVIENSNSNISGKLNCAKLPYSNQSKDDTIHRWLFANRELLANSDRIVIPVRLGEEDAEYMGLYVGLHIRLTKELEDARNKPLIFVTDDTREELLSNQINARKLKTALLLFTKGAYTVSAFSLDEWIRKVLSPINEEVLMEYVMPALHIEHSKDPGHQLANDWGAFRLAKFAGCKLTIEKPTSLYFKYKDAWTRNEILPNANNTLGLFKESCKALLIDDNANSGWTEVLNHILRKRIIDTSRPVQLNVINTFEEALNCSTFLEYDIIFLDLRLLKQEDRSGHLADITEFSGTKILQQIKSLNQGLQVIIFTASNKVWNIEKLLSLGANGYYIKESPEFVLSTQFSKDNYDEFIKTIKECLTRKPLKNIFLLTGRINSTIDELTKGNKVSKGFGKEIKSSIETANKILNSAKVENDFAMSYLVLFKCIELINDNFVVQDASTKTWQITVDGPLRQYKYDVMLNKLISISPVAFKNDVPTTMEKLSGFLFQFLGFADSDFRDVYFGIQRRNKFIHPDDGGKLTQLQVNECKQIFSFAGYSKLIVLIESIFTKLKGKL